MTETFTVGPLTVQIGYEDNCEHADPREVDNLGTMVCWHPDYVLGDYQLEDGAGRGAVREAFETETHGRTDFASMAVLERYLRLGLSASVVLPLYLLDHSGISMRAGSPSAGDPGGWDTTMVGFIYTTPARVTELCGAPDYCPPDWDGTPQEWLAKQLRDEVALYDAWLRGEVYYYAVLDEDGDTLDRVGGYLADEDEAREAGREAAAWQHVLRVEAERRRVAGWAFARCR